MKDILQPGLYEKILQKGSPREKAILVCQTYIELQKLNREPLITSDQVDELKSSLTTVAEQVEYNRYVRQHYIMCDLVRECGFAMREFQTFERTAIGYILLWREYDNQEANLNHIYKEVVESESSKTKKNFVKTINALSFQFGKAVQYTDGRIEVTRDELYTKLQDEEVYYTRALTAIKAFIVSVEEWAKRNRCKSIIPQSLQQSFKTIKDSRLAKVDPRFTKGYLQLLESQGKEITGDDVKRAIFPTYHDVRPSIFFLRFYNNLIKSKEKEWMK